MPLLRTRPHSETLWHSGLMDDDSLSSPAGLAAIEPLSSDSDTADVAVLFLHGITGSPAAWRPLARAIASEGYAVRVPLLPGHGTNWQQLNSSRWEDWRDSAAAELESLAERYSSVVVVGLSMGGALALDIAASDAPVGGLVLVNPALRIDSAVAPLLPVLKYAVRSVTAIGNDIARPGEDEHAYPRTPLRAVASLQRGQRRLLQRLWKVRVPTTVCVSAGDHVVGPWSLRQLRARLRCPLKVVTLRSSYHVATLDYDDHLILQEIRNMCERVRRDAADGADARAEDAR